jgi:hypothetical protein
MTWNGRYVNVGDIYAYGGSGIKAGVVYCDFAIGFGEFLPGGVIMSVSQGNPFDYIQTARFINVRLEKDFSLSLLGPSAFMIDQESGLPCNTGLQTGPTMDAPLNPSPYFMPGLPGSVVGGPCWAYFTLAWELSLSPLNTIEAGATLTVNFGAGACGGSVDTGIAVDDTPLGLLEANMYELYGGNSIGGNFANFAAATQGSPIPNPVVPPVYVNARVSQMAVELITVPSGSVIDGSITNARMSQAAIELLTLPYGDGMSGSFTNARMSQAAIELLAGYPPTPTGGGVIPQYIKRRNEFSNS